MAKGLFIKGSLQKRTTDGSDGEHTRTEKEPTEGRRDEMDKNDEFAVRFCPCFLFLVSHG
jgi:hypothetical protein